MRQRGMYIAIVLLLAVNAIVLAGALYNRTGEPDAVTTLTERELPIAYSYQMENSGVSLRIDTNHHYYGGLSAPLEYDSFSWLNRKKLEALGFDFSAAPRDSEDYDYYYKQLPRKAYAVLEFDGPAWEGWKKRMSDQLAKVDEIEKEGKKTAKELDTARKNIEQALRTNSHLFIIDVGSDPAALRKQYPDRQHYLILPSTVRISYYGSYPAPGLKTDNIRGYVDILTSEVNLPHRMHVNVGEQKKPGFPSRMGAGIPESGPRYQVVLQTGKRYEPWVEEVQPIR